MLIKNPGNKRILLLILLVVPILLFYLIFQYPANKENGKQVEIFIPRGASLDQIADTLKANQLISNKKFFVLWATLSGFETKLRAGHFKVPKDLHSAQLVSYLSEARPTEIFVTLIEGWENQQIAKELSEKLKIDSSKFDSLCSDSAFISGLGLKNKNLIGYLLPDTYSFTRGLSAQSVIEYLVNQTLNIFKTDSIKLELDQLKMNINQILTLASIVEGRSYI